MRESGLVLGTEGGVEREVDSGRERIPDVTTSDTRMNNILPLLGQIGGRDPTSHPSILQDSQKMQLKRIFGSSSRSGGM